MLQLLHLHSRLNTSLQYCTKGTARPDKKHLSFLIWCGLYQSFYNKFNCNVFSRYGWWAHKSFVKCIPALYGEKGVILPLCGALQTILCLCCIRLVQQHHGIWMILWADSRFAPSQWETGLHCNNISHWLGTSIVSDLMSHYITVSSWWAWWRLKSPGLDYLLNCLFRRRSKKLSKLHTSLAFVRGNHQSLVDSPHKGPVMQKMFPFDGIIMEQPPGDSFES